MYEDAEGNTLLPGYGRPLKDSTSYYTDRQRFPSGLLWDLWEGLAGGYPLTLREILMQQIMNDITDKPEWHRLIFNEYITMRWKEDIIRSDEDVSEKMFEYMFDELKHKAKILSSTGVVGVFDQGVVKSDDIVPEEFRSALVEAVKALEDVPYEFRNWRPGTGKTVLDLVDPSLFPLVYGLSRILPKGRMSEIEEGLTRSAEGVVIPAMEKSTITWSNLPSSSYIDDLAYSRKFQWLPCEVDISSDKARITSYINNLHPVRHKDLYSLIERLIDYSIPLWDKVLTSLAHPSGQVEPRIKYGSGDLRRYHDIPPESDFITREDGESDYSYNNRKHSLLLHSDQGRDWSRTVRNIIQPDPGAFKPFKPKEQVHIRNLYAEYGLQVIVDIVNIHLTPDKPEYEGGLWHIEGQANEHIVAMPFYFHSEENVTDSMLAFRQHCNLLPFRDVQEGHIYMFQESFNWLADIYGLKFNFEHDEESSDVTVQALGGVKAAEGRLLAFQNTMQHQFQPFRLSDPTKPGFRKFVALYLVDPTFKITSTANVPCQRKDWWQEQLKDIQIFDKLPTELTDLLFQDIDFPYGIDKAKELRDELLEEQNLFVTEHTNRVFNHPEWFDDIFYDRNVAHCM